MKLVIAAFLAFFIAVSGYAQNITPQLSTSLTYPERVVNDFGTKEMTLKPQGSTDNTSAWSFGFVMDFNISGGKTHIGLQAVAFNDFKNFTVNGKPTHFYWAGFIGSTVDKEGHTAAGMGIHYVQKWLDQFYFGGFLGFDIQTGGMPSGLAAGLNVGIKF